MPELPEVETVRDGLQRYVVGRTVETVQILNPRAVRRDPRGPAGFEAAMTGRPLKKAERRGKYLWLTLDDGEALLAHLGMSGQLLVDDDPDRPLSSHVRARFTFADGGPDLRFTDQRTFGHLLLAPLVPAASVGAAGLAGSAAAAAAAAGAGLAALAGRAMPAGRVVPAPIAHIAPDPLEEAFDAADFAARLRRKRTGVKRALLDQSLISGVGNIYADEALWRAKLHWARPTETLRAVEVSRLLAAVTEVLGEALRAGGTSFDALYVNVNGESGYFDRSLNAYGRMGEPCGRCGSLIRRDAFMNRSSYSCPRCQPKPRNAHVLPGVRYAELFIRWVSYPACLTPRVLGRARGRGCDRRHGARVPTCWARDLFSARIFGKIRRITGNRGLLNLTTKGLGENLVTVDARKSVRIECVPTLVTQCGGPLTMAKALFGHVGGPDPRMVSEMRRLQQRVRDLEAELARLQAENDALAGDDGHEDNMLAVDREPALA